MALSSFPPSPASHPCLCKEPGSICVARSRKQSRSPGHGCEGQEYGEAESLEGSDPAVPGVVTCRQQCQALRCVDTRWVGSLRPLSPAPGQTLFSVNPQSQKEHSSLRTRPAWLLCSAWGTGNGSGLQQVHPLSGNQQPVTGIPWVCGSTCGKIFLLKINLKYLAGLLSDPETS